MVARAVGIDTAGANLLKISAVGSEAMGTQALVNAVITRYRARAAAESERQTSIAVEYFNNQIAVARAELDTRLTALNSYLGNHPGAGDSRSGDLNYQRLAGAADSQTKVVDGLLSLLQEAQRTAASAPQSLEAIFSVQDDASLPAAPQSLSISKRVGYPAAGLVFGLLIAASYLYAAYRTDHTIRGLEDVTELNVPLLGCVPDIRAGRRHRLVSRVARLAWWARRKRWDYARQVAVSISPVVVKGGSR